MSIILPLANRHDCIALISVQDQQLVSPYRWRLSTNGYVVASVKQNGQWTTLYLHRLILQAQPGQQCDHIDRDKLNNTRENLRLATPQQNARNRRRYRRSRSGPIGVRQRGKRFQASLRVNGKKTYLGTYDTRTQAMLIRDAFARRVDPTFFALNMLRTSSFPRIEAMLDAFLSPPTTMQSLSPITSDDAQLRYRGVYLERGRWRAKISVQSHDIHLGYFETPEAAARAYDEAACQYHGSRARLNFPRQI